MAQFQNINRRLEDTFRQYGHGIFVDSLLEQGASFSRVPCGLDKLLEDTFRQFECDTSVDFLLEQGASFSQVPCGLDKLLEDKFRQYGCDVCVDFLLEQGASFYRVPCGLDKLLEDTFRQYGYDTSIDFLLEQGASFSQVPCGLDKLLEDTFRQYGCDISVDFLLEQGASFSRVPCGLDKLLEDTFRRYGHGTYVDFLLEQDAFSHMPCGFHELLKNRFGANTSVDLLLQQASHEILIEIVKYVRSFQTSTEVRNMIDYEADRTRWPKVSDGGPLRFLPKSIGYLREKLASPDWKPIVAQGRAILASKTLLSAQSPYFNALFNSGFEESFEDIISMEELSFETMRFAIYFGETEPSKVNWSPFFPDQDIEKTADNLDSLLDILRVADMFGMKNLHNDVQRQIVLNGTGFIWPENVCMIQTIAEEVNGRLLSSYCTTFLELNKV